MKTNINKIVDFKKVGTYTSPIDFAKIDKFAKADRVESAKHDAIKVLFVGIDYQYCFMENVGSLGVGGSIDDVKRAITWLYNNGDKVSRVMLSMDDHVMQQIFFPCWWVDDNGNHPDPYTFITYDDVVHGKWIPNFDKLVPYDGKPGNMEVSYCSEYVRKLEEGGKQKLQIWPYHAIGGGSDANIEAQLCAMVYYHSRIRGINPYIARKGTDPWTEMYSLIKPEWSLDNYINKPVLDEMSKYDIVIFTGEAASHCAGLTVLDTVQYFSGIGAKKPRFVILRDCMSPIPTFEAHTEELYKTLEKEYKVLVTESTKFSL